MSRTSLSRRLPLLMAGVAAIAVLLGALVAWPLLRAAADSTAQRTLSRTADLTAELLQRTVCRRVPDGPAGRRERAAGGPAGAPAGDGLPACAPDLARSQAPLRDVRRRRP